MDKNELNKILINKKIEKELNTVLKFIPELRYTMGFEQNHPHHYLDVWEHTLLALDNLETNDLETNMALLLHDIGKPFSYQDEEVRHFHGHADKSEQMARDILNRLGYEQSFINNVCYLVKNHDLLIDPDNLDNSEELLNKRLQIQYADAKAHSKNKIKKRVRVLDEIKRKINKQKIYR